MSRSFTLAAALTLAAATGLLTEAVAASAATSTTARRVPVEAHVSGASTAQPFGNLVAFDARGTGMWTGHGRVSFEVKGTLDPRPACPTFTGRETLTLLGKNQPTGSLGGTVTGFGCPRTTEPTLLDVQATNVVDGGTGAFTSASGGWHVGGTFNLATGAFSHPLRGMVLVPAH